MPSRALLLPSPQPKQIHEIKDFLLTARRKDAKCTLTRIFYECMLHSIAFVAFCHTIWCDVLAIHAVE